VASLSLSPAARAQVERLLRLIEAVENELHALETELRRFARADRRCLALQTIYGVGPILACHLLAELGEATRFRRARQAVRAAGLDPAVDESGETRRRGHLAKHGAPVLPWALVEAAQHAQRANSPDRGLHTQAATRVGNKRAVLTVARKIGRRAYHVLNELETQAA
jgi:transposase